MNIGINMLQIRHKSIKIFPLLKIHLLMLILLKIIDKKQFTSIFIDSDDKYTLLLGVLNIMNIIDNPSKPIE